MCVLDLEPCDVWEESVHLARKEHVCSSCCLPIRPGDAYLSHFQVFEGEPFREKMCFVCWLAREEFAESHGVRCLPSALDDLVRSCIDDGLAKAGNPWRPVLAVILRRFRGSRMRKIAMAARWTRRAARAGAAHA